MLKKFNFLQKIKNFLIPIYFQSRNYTINGKEYLLRQATIEDVKALLEVERLVYDGQTPWEKSAFYKELLSKQTHLYLVLLYDSKVVGFAGVRIFLQDGHVTNVAIIPDFQNQKLGKLLLTTLENFSKKEKCQTLSLEVRKSNIDAQRFYRFYGFESVRVKPNYYTDTPEDAIDMVKKI